MLVVLSLPQAAKIEIARNNFKNPTGFSHELTNRFDRLNLICGDIKITKDRLHKLCVVFIALLEQKPQSDIERIRRLRNTGKTTLFSMCKKIPKRFDFSKNLMNISLNGPHVAC